MRNIILFMLLLFINCNSQRKIADKKYMDVETTFQKYRDIKARYDSSVEKNKQNLIYESGGYFNKYLYDKEAKEKRYTPENSNAKFVLNEDGKKLFVVNYSRGDLLYIYKNENLYERINLSKDENIINSVYNLENNTSIKYYPDGRIYIQNYEKDKEGQNELILEKLYKNEELIHEKNYKKDFTVSKEQLLKKLADNFYNSAVRYLDKIDFRTEFSMQNDVKKLVEHNLPSLKEKIEKTVKTKDNFYRELSISKTYNMDNYPIYNISIPDMLIGFWEMKIDGKTNEVIDIKLEISKE